MKRFVIVLWLAALCGMAFGATFHQVTVAGQAVVQNRGSGSIDLDLNITLNEKHLIEGYLTAAIQQPNNKERLFIRALAFDALKLSSDGFYLSGIASVHTNDRIGTKQSFTLEAWHNGKDWIVSLRAGKAIQTTGVVLKGGFTRSEID
jgi:hypothetical protein